MLKVLEVLKGKLGFRVNLMVAINMANCFVGDWFMIDFVILPALKGATGHCHRTGHFLYPGSGLPAMMLHPRCPASWSSSRCPSR